MGWDAQNIYRTAFGNVLEVCAKRLRATIVDSARQSFFKTDNYYDLYVVGNMQNGRFFVDDPVTVAGTVQPNAFCLGRQADKCAVVDT